MTRSLKFIDVFAGCGGLSLGLVNAGFKGVFAVEKSSMAFTTLSKNLIAKDNKFFEWPIWLPIAEMTCEDLLKKYSDELIKLKGQIDVMVGGPPCQGFSLAGRRDPVDPRNKMSEQYLALVGLIQPTFLVIENVAGINMKFEKSDTAHKGSYAKSLSVRLEAMGYHVSSGLLNCADFGVPQNRRRFLIICARKSEVEGGQDLFKLFLSSNSDFRKKHGLPSDRHVNVEEAISDLEVNGKLLDDCRDSTISGYKQIKYVAPVILSAYQILMRNRSEGSGLNSLRLAKHKKSTVEKFKLIQTTCRAGISISEKEMATVGTKKHSITVLDRKRPSPTVTTLPDDILHYSEARILTVRESARLQSFPDWYQFEGKYTTGGKKRKMECPRYTQVGNAVPPLVAEAIGTFLGKRIIESEIVAPVDCANKAYND